MTTLTILAGSYFDGRRCHDRGAYEITIQGGLISAIRRCESAVRRCESPAAATLTAAFVMPGLCEAHCHLFLDGGELDLQKRKAYLAAPRAAMLARGRHSLAENLAAGVTLIRDAGDLFGVNTQMKAELSGQSGVRPTLRSPGVALRKTGRYGGFMAIEASDAAGIARALKQIAPEADDLKILLTGIIDFEKGCMKGGVQFSLEEARLIAAIARDLGKKTYAHASGREGLEIAVAAGIDSIEHGFFMNREILERMAERGIAWVPTIGPVQFPFERPELLGLQPGSVESLRRILDNHFEHLALAAELGVPIVAGSDAGSYGVPHGRGLLDELRLLRRAGLSLEQVLAAATSVPRRLWGCESADIAVGNVADLILLDRSPFQDAAAHWLVRGIVRGSAYRPLAQVPAGFTVPAATQFCQVGRRGPSAT